MVSSFVLRISCLFPKHVVILAAWCGVLFLYGVADGPLYRTEALRAIIGRACLDGQWLFPVLYGEPFLTKPPGHYAAIGLCSLPFGEVSAASARLPSVIAATVSVFLVYGMFRRAFDERAALLASLLLPTSVLWLDKVPSAEIDMTLVGWVTAAIALAHRAIERESTRRGGGGGGGRGGGGAPPWSPHPQPRGGPPPPPPPAIWWVLALLCVAGGTLTKWTAPAFFYLAVLPLLAWRGEWRILFGWRHLVAVGVAGLACATWVFAVAQQIGYESLFETVQKEAAYRFSPKSSSRGYPWGELGTYPLLVLAAHLPVSAFALLTLRPGFAAKWDDRGQLMLQLLHCWTWPNLLFWTLVPNHNVRYSLPMSPGLMGLGAMGLLSFLASVGREFGGWVGPVGLTRAATEGGPYQQYGNSTGRDAVRGGPPASHAVWQDA
ncbi:ArnT family glycosyltransferase, partial [Gemmata sp.]|uniref:ArnT family glycosyltransferase n=1 Tax=Gemmata sp. TaxID=1914242 RepID=UPI003F6F57B2